MLPPSLKLCGANQEIFDSIKQNFHKVTRPKQNELRKIKVKIIDDAVEKILQRWKYGSISKKQLAKELKSYGYRVNSMEVSKAMQRLIEKGKAAKLGKRTFKLLR